MVSDPPVLPEGTSEPQKAVENQEFTGTQIITGSKAATGYGLFQHPFPLTEADFIHLRTKSPMPTSELDHYRRTSEKAEDQLATILGGRWQQRRLE